MFVSSICRLESRRNLTLRKNPVVASGLDIVEYSERNMLTSCFSVNSSGSRNSEASFRNCSMTRGLFCWRLSRSEEPDWKRLENVCPGILMDMSTALFTLALAWAFSSVALAILCWRAAAYFL
ncbi:uncharacterized protein LOC131994301 [Stomoxys calcitrans]|uniref:uncharacterized protein LOC131994301 n=1 Tax=Stomoxys calcitrans TaxID=35570 RepID=UPI0027E26A24|nr:uncharacterized protein LOC131994301 [Stomoxys calcitrans]